jgi:amino acid transporter
MEDQGIGGRLKDFVIGKARSPHDPHIFRNLSLIAFFAWIGLGSDGLSSSCYGPEEAFRALGEHYHLAIAVAVATAVTIFVISASYSQIIELFPSGGGGYLVASKLLSPTVGMVSGCALLLDYVLTITISVASGTDALFSFLPAGWLHAKLGAAVVAMIILMLLNLRGVRESVLPLVPIFLTFVVMHAFAILYAIVLHSLEFPTVVRETAADVQRTYATLGGFGMLALILRAYSMGAGTYTGIEAVSNSLPVLREPRVQTARRTMTYMAVSLAFVAMGLMIAYILFHARPSETKTLNAVLFENITAPWPKTMGNAFVLITLISEALVLFVAAQTGFLGGPRVLANMAVDRWVPTSFATLSDRLVTQNGILVMGASALLILILTGGSVRFLVVLYSINVFITFLLSQLGMVRHWWQVRRTGGGWRRPITINGIGLVMTGFILISITVVKFNEGGWITLLITSGLVALSWSIRRHYTQTGRLIGRLNSLVEMVDAEMAEPEPAEKPVRKAHPAGSPQSKTAVLLTNGYSGLGLHTLFNVIRLFGEVFDRYVFLGVGVIDAGQFKGREDLDELRERTARDAERYVAYMRRHGYEAEALTSIGIDIIDEVSNMTEALLKKYPNAVFFGGQLVFSADSFVTRVLHNYTAFAVQRRFYRDGIPVIILPVRV